MNDELYPEMLAALTLAGLHCSDPGKWDDFEGWVRDKGGFPEDGHLSREFMMIAASAMKLTIKQVEIELQAARLNEETGT